MATVTGLTSARMLAIEAASVVSGVVTAGHLILTKHDASTIDAGSVIGPTGAPGIAAADFVGIIAEFINTTPPTGWLALTGQTIVGGQTTYPLLWAVLPASMKSGANIVFPDTRGNVSVGYKSGDADFGTIGGTGGSKTHTLTQAELPAVTITIDPPSTAVTITDPGHHHNVTVNGGGSYGNLIVEGAANMGSVNDGLINNAVTGISAVVDIASFASGNLGSGSAHSILQPYVTFLKMIKVG